MSAGTQGTGHRLSGQRLGAWRLGGPLGSGGLGLVFEATAADGRRAALKTFDLASDPGGELAAAFEREVTASRRLAHPDIVAVLDAGEAQGLAYLAMEFVDGHDLARHASAGDALPDSVIFGLAARAARALAHAHSQGVIHRDVKPANILVNWPLGVVKLCDFGIARLGDVFRSRTGVMFGTPAYMSPEQLADLSLDGRTDLYSLGVVLHELLTLRRPHVATSLGELLRLVTRGPAPRLASLRPDLPAPACALVDGLLDRQPGCRPGDAAFVAEEADRIRIVLGDAPPGWPPGPKSRG